MNLKTFISNILAAAKRVAKPTDWKEGYLQLIAEIEPNKSRLDTAERFFVDTLKKQIDNEVAVSRHQAVALNEIWERVAS